MKTKSKSNLPKYSDIDFRNSMSELISAEELEDASVYQKKKSGRPSAISVAQIITALVYHGLNKVGTLGEHFRMVTGLQVSESTLSERRQKMPWEVFRRVMALALRHIGIESNQEESFYKGKRLIALDGTTFSLRNTPQITKMCSKSVTRRLHAAFAKVSTCVLLELGTHHPIAAEIATEQESEWELGLRIIERIPEGSLFLADRLYGCMAYISGLLSHCKETSSDFLVRGRSQIKVKRLKRLPDKSWLVEVPVPHPTVQHRILGYVKLREMNAKIHRPGFRATTLRLWTSMLKSSEAPAEELIELYSKRWEHELYYRELKRDLSDGDLLSSNLPETAAQEIAALILASALVARTRLASAESKRLPSVTSVGFARALELVKQLWTIFALTDDILSEEQRREITKRLLEVYAPTKVPKKRPRSYKREVRQPIKGWPRKTKNSYRKSELVVNINAK